MRFFYITEIQITGKKEIVVSHSLLSADTLHIFHRDMCTDEIKIGFIRNDDAMRKTVHFMGRSDIKSEDLKNFLLGRGSDIFCIEVTFGC